MKNHRVFPLVAILAIAFYVAGSAAAQTASISTASRPATPGAAVQLSAFEVTTSKDIGYQSSNSAEVTRMNTGIVDIPMNVTVFNQQFMEDILARDTTDVLDYEASVRTTSSRSPSSASSCNSASAAPPPIARTSTA